MDQFDSITNAIRHKRTTAIGLRNEAEVRYRLAMVSDDMLSIRAAIDACECAAAAVAEAQLAPLYEPLLNRVVKLKDRVETLARVPDPG